MEMMKQGAMMTVLSSLLSALALPATLLTLTDIIDSKWSIAVHRPVTLIGFSLGAQVIFKCLENLAESNHAGIVERAVLLGAPIAIQDENWEAARRCLLFSNKTNIKELFLLQVVPGRLINAYSTND
ncbi:transmembrane and coiled-coil domain-containing protein 4-like protein isoform X2 [Tanacetum coccineum]